MTRCAFRSRARERGVALILTMVVLVLVGLASAAIMRDAISGSQVVSNGRLLVQAGQFAQVALRLCERQLTLPSDQRSVATLDAQTPPAWTRPPLWIDGPALRAYVLGAADISSPVQPRVAPRCMIEASALPGVFTVTARGFSPDFAADPDSGALRAGAVVWLQSTVLVAGDGTRIAQRTWQRLLTPPF